MITQSYLMPWKSFNLLIIIKIFCIRSVLNYEKKNYLQI